MDSSHGTSTSTGTNSSMRSVGRPSGVQASDDDEDFFYSGGRSMLREEEAQVASRYLAQGDISCWAKEIV